MSIDNLLFILNWIIISAVILLSFEDLRRISLKERIWTISTPMIFLFGVLAGTFGFVSADYYGYKLLLDRLSIWGVGTEVEPVYWYIAQYTDYKVILFRLVLFISYYSLLPFLVRLFDIQKNVTYNIFIILLFLPTAAILRSSLADVVLWIGIILFWKKSNFRSFLLFIVLGVIGMFLHKSSFMVILLFLLSYLPLKKVGIQFYIICLPFVIIIVRLVVPIIFAQFFESSNYDKALQSQSTIGSLKIAISIVYTLIFGLFILINSKEFCFSRLPNKMYKVLFWAFFLWFVFLFSGASRFIGERLYAHASIPLLYMVSLLFINGSRRTKQLLLIFLFFGFLVNQLGILVVWAYHENYLLKNIYI